MKINLKRISFFLHLVILIAVSGSASLFAQAAAPPADKPYTETTTFFILGALLFGIAIIFASIMIFDVRERDVQAIKAEKKRKIILSDEQLTAGPRLRRNQGTG